MEGLQLRVAVEEGGGNTVHGTGGEAGQVLEQQEAANKVFDRREVVRSV